MIIKCIGSEELLQVNDKKLLKKVLKEINNSRREGTEEMEFPEGHDVTVEMVSGEAYDMTLFDNGKVLMKGFYVHSDISNFCEK
ncbi:hypothetical protein [Psychrobacillus sp. NPDC096623]|uniref:hypothetical protein n=1 Tax=Psychrobacillus sp. NPDC096623 TaxID=3364492 RepID=UPI00382F0CF0